MNHLMGRIVTSGTYLTDAIPILLDDVAGRETSAWTGQFVLPSHCAAPKAPCSLQLEDGRVGDIVIYRTDGGAERAQIARFRGIGLLRRAG